MQRADSTASQTVGWNHRGVSVVELIVGVGLLLAVAGALVSDGLGLGLTGSDAPSLTDLESQGQRTLERIRAELSGAGYETLFPRAQAPLSETFLEYQIHTGSDAEGARWGAPRRLALELREGELDNGLDDDGNGLADDYVLVWTDRPGEPGERRINWCPWVSELLEGEIANGRDDNGNGLIDEPGLSFETRGQSVCVRLSLEGADPQGQPVVHTFETTVPIQN